MATLNFKHLRYLWMFAKTGSIARANGRLWNFAMPNIKTGDSRWLDVAEKLAGGSVAAEVAGTLDPFSVQPTRLLAGRAKNFHRQVGAPCRAP